MAGTPLSVLDPPGSPTIDGTYAKMEKNISVILFLFIYYENI